MDYSRSIMDIVEAHLSSTPQYAGSNRVGSSSELDKVLEQGEKEPADARKDMIRRAYNNRRYG